MASRSRGVIAAMPLTAPTTTSPNTMITNRPMRSMSDGLAGITASLVCVAGGVQRTNAITCPQIWMRRPSAQSQ
jgi:hypothetical protein